MAESNREALGQGLRLYSEGMARFAKQRLVGAFPNSWWEDGVVKALPNERRQGLQRETEKDPGADKGKFLEPSILVHVIPRNHRHFQDAYPHYRQVQSLLTQVSESRNQWAHNLTEDLPADDVGHCLYAMNKLLSQADLPEAKQVEELRRKVMGLGAGDSVQAAHAPVEDAPRERPVPARSNSGLPYWWEVCEPHDGFKNPANIDESRFAASLGRVFAEAASEEYLDPISFLSQTYFTENLTQMLREISSRLNGGDGAAATEIQTPFGGGKTHALLTFYHLVRSPQQALSVPGVTQALGDSTMPPNARVLVFDGQEHGTEPVLKENGVSVSTMWGELTSQIDAGLYQRLIMDSDGKGVAPGNSIFSEVLKAASPCLILIDEVVSYLVKLRFSNSRRTQNLYRQTVQFLQETLQLAGETPGICVLISLPRSRIEFGGLDPQHLQRELQITEEVQARADRVVSKRTPVNDDEIYLLMSRRLFKQADQEVARQAAESYREIYEKTPGQYDPTVRSADYFNQQIAAYPFHPELIDVLYKKWSTSSDFPRTRAVLQLLANIVADQWTNRRGAHTIQSGHVNLERERIRTRIVSAAGSGGGYDAVVASDIIGGEAHADNEDERRGGEYARFRISRGVATTLLVHSFGGMMRAGATPQELRLGTVSPNIGPEYVTEVLGTLEQSLWYVHREGELLKFQTRPNVYRVIAQTADNQAPNLVLERLREEVEKVAKDRTGFRVVSWPAVEGGIADTAEPTIVLLHPSLSVESADATIRGEINRLWDRAGGGLRTYRNSLLLIAADSELWKSGDESMREVLAYDAVISGRTAQQLSEGEKADLTSRRRDKQDSLATSIVTAYRWVFYPSDDGLDVISLPVPATKGQRIANRAIDRLSDQDYGNPKILSAMGAMYFNSRICSRLWADRSKPLDLGETSRRFPQWTYLPILLNREETLRRCIREGLDQSLWAIAVGDGPAQEFQSMVEEGVGLDQLVTLFDGSAWLVGGDLRASIKEQLNPTSTEVESIESPEDPGGQGELNLRETVPDYPQPPEPIPVPAKRFAKVRLNLSDLSVGKTNNLQPYLFKFLQEQDAGAQVNITIEVTSSAGISQEYLDQRIIESLDQLGIAASWEEL